jgi:hypothetical protein
MGCLWVDGGPINPHVFISIIYITSTTSTTMCLLTKREERPQQHGHKREVLATMIAGIVIFRFSTNNSAIWPNSYRNPMRRELFPTSSKFRLTWGGGPVLTVPPKITHWVGVQSLQSHLLREPINPRCGLICGLTASINPLLTRSLVVL